ncbi:hypothetical protein TWF281_008454 [Arthrobotrys megalospora]
MDPGRGLFNYLGTTFPPEVSRAMRLQALIPGFNSSSDRIRANTQLTSTNLRKCLLGSGVNTHQETEPVDSSVRVSLPLEIQFMILEEADAQDHGNLARVCKAWHIILQRSRVAQLKRYIDYSVELVASSNGSPYDRPTLGLPPKFKIHRMVRIHLGNNVNQQYIFKDDYGLQENQLAENYYCFRSKGSYPGLNVFTEDPIFIFPDQDPTITGECKGDKRISEASFAYPSGPDPDEPVVTLSQVFFYKYQTSGFSPTILGSGIHSPPEDITLTRSSTVKSYTETLVSRMKEIAELAREKRYSELSKSNKDKQLIALWERLTTTDGRFLFQVQNHTPLHQGHRLTLKEDESEARESVMNELPPSNDVRPKLLDVLPVQRSYISHPFSDLEDDLI